MFDIGFSELVLIAVVALVVLGPERLPRAARFAGLWVRRARAQWYSVKAEFEREVAAEELKRSLDTVKTDVKTAVRAADEQARIITARVRDEINHLSDATSTSLPSPDAADDVPANASSIPMPHSQDLPR